MTEVDGDVQRPGKLWREAGLVALCLLALVLLVFRGYLTGALTPPWDFLGSYNTEAYAWWERGSFFHPQDWMPYAWGGYPAAASIQNSAWYLPVGIVALFTGFTIRASAVLAVAHYAFGALGVYVLVRRFGMSRAPAMLGMTAFFFVSGFYAQAEYVDISRGYAWIPWLLLIASPRWPWHRWWSIPLAALLIWQAVLAMYPGVAAASLYCLGVWVAVHQLRSRPRLRDYLVPLVIAGVLAVALLAPKYVPALLLDTSAHAEAADASQFSLAVALTAFLPYGGKNIVGDIAMRSFFLPATAFLLALFARFRSRLGAPAAAMLGIATVLGIPSWPWHPWIALLPGMTLSRYRMSDFRPFMLVAVCLLASTAVGRFYVKAEVSRRRALVSAGLLTAFPVALAVGASAAGFEQGDVAVPLAVSIAVVGTIWIAFLRLPSGLAHLRVAGPPAAAMLAALTLVSGVSGAFATQAPWRASRAYAETVTYGAPVDRLLAQGEGTPVEAQQRKARQPLAASTVQQDLMSPRWNAGYYANFDAVGGYVNLKRSESFWDLRSALLDPATFPSTEAFFAAPGIAVSLQPDGSLPGPDSVTTCVRSHACGPGVEVVADAYRPGDLAYRATLSSPATLAFNESYYLGWHVHAESTVGGGALDLRAGRGPAGSTVVALPAGSWRVTLDYVPPGNRKAWLLFFAAVIAMPVIGPLSSILRRRDRAAGSVSRGLGVPHHREGSAEGTEPAGKRMALDDDKSYS